MFKLINSLVSKANPDDYGDVKKEFVDMFTTCVDMIFVYAVTWSIGGNLDSEGRTQFSLILKETINKINTDKGWTVPVPEGDAGYYDITIDTTNNEFIPWSQIQKVFEFNSKFGYDEIVVPTEDSTKYIEISASLLKAH